TPVEEVDHLLDRRDARNRLFRKRKTERDCTDELAVDVDGRAGHTRKHACFFDIRAAESRDNGRLPWPRKSRQHAENLNTKFLGARAAEDGPRCSLHARTKVVEGKNFRGFWCSLSEG